MSDCDLEPLEDYVMDTLPGVNSEQRADIVAKLFEVGVEQPADFEFVKETDLQELALKKVQVRKLLANWNQAHGSTDSPRCSQKLDTSAESTSADSESMETESVESDAQGTDVGVPWNKFPPELLADLEAGRRPSPSLRKEMVRIIVSNLFNPDRRLPRVKVFRMLAKDIVLKYPKSFADEVDGVTIGTGYDSLLSQLVNRVDNVARQKLAGQKRKVPSSTPESKSNKTHDAYGCVSWQPLSLPKGQTEKTQDELRKYLKDAYQSDVQVDESEVESKMDLTYASQRAMINQPEVAMLDIVEDWPYLFVEKHMMRHFKKLTGIDVQSEMTASLEKRGPKLLRFFRLRPTNDAHYKEIQAQVKDVDEACRITGTETPRVVGLVYLLAAYFGEDASFHIISEKEVGQPVNRDKLPGHPCLIAHGNPLQTSELSLSIGQVLTTRLRNPVSALSGWFAAYYIFNLHYPKDASGVPEFFQRFFLRINPDTGSKKKGRKSGVHPAVLKLASQLANFENEWGL